MRELSEVRPDLTLFTNVNTDAKSGKKLSWDRRVTLIEKQFPVARSLDWVRAFQNDLDLFAWIFNDIMKADCATPGRSGPKPSVDIKMGAARLRQFMGEDYSTLPFSEAFAVLTGGRSLTSVARKTTISRSQVHRLLQGAAEPTAWEMEQIAKAYGKPAGYFSEYRKALIIAALADKLEKHPEASVKYWRELALAAS